MGRMLKTAEWLKRKGRSSAFRSAIVFEDPDHIYIDEEAEIGDGTVIEPNVRITGRTAIGKNCRVGFGSVIKTSKLRDGCSIENATLQEVQVGLNSSVGPYSVIEHSVIGRNVKIGVHVQIKRSVIKTNTKVPHNCYIGDAIVGRRVNFSAGAVTCNYDGQKKKRTLIQDDAFVGVNVSLIAPLTVGRETMIAAGSTIPENFKIPPNCIVIARVRDPYISKSVKIIRDGRGWRKTKNQRDNSTS